MVEDVLQASLPGFIDAVRIADIGQGTNPVRIVSMRALADQPGHPDYPREEWVGLDKDAQSKAQATDMDVNGDSSVDPAEQVDTDQTGDYLVGHKQVSFLFLVVSDLLLRCRIMKSVCPTKPFPDKHIVFGSTTST